MTDIFCTVITDASFCPKTRAAGWAAWVVCDGVRHQASGPMPHAPASSNAAEIYALQMGIEQALRVFKPASILVQSDCMGALTQIGLKGSEKKSRYRPLGQTTLGLRHFIASAHVRVMAKHVKGHTRDPAARSYVNRWCDKEARKHMLAGRGKSTEEADDWSPIDTEDKFDG